MKRQPTVFIEALGLVEGHFSGIGQYILGILKGIDSEVERRLIAGDIKPNIKVIVTKDTLTKFRDFNFKYLQPVSLPFSFQTASGLFYRQKLPPLDLFFGKGLYLFTRFSSTPLMFSKSATIIYDISFELYPEYADDRNAKFLKKAVRKSISRSNRLFTISDNAKKEIVGYYDVDEDKISVATPAAPSDVFYKRSDEEIANVLDKYELPESYVLALSNLEPRKNLSLLIDAFAALPKSKRNGTALVLVGVNGWKADALFKKIVEHVKDGVNIRRPSSYVLDEDKPALYSGAKVLAYPSHYEGFGMPPLEAISCGTPVISADNSSLPQAVGDCATMIKSTSHEGMKSALLDHLENEASHKKTLATHGPEHAAQFSWHDSARKILEELEAL